MLVAQRLISAKPTAQKYSYRGTYTSTQLSSTPAFSITGVDIGPAVAGRVVVVVVTFWYGYNVSSLIVNAPGITIGGVPATQRVSQYSTTSSNKKAIYIYSAVVPTGTTADIVINHSYTKDSPTVAHKSCSVFTIPAPTSPVPVKTGTPSTLADNRRCDMTVTNSPPIVGIIAGIAEVTSDPTPAIPIQWDYSVSYIENPTRGLDSRLIDSGTNTHMFVGVYEGIGDSMATYTAEPLAASLSSDYGAYAAWQVG